MGIMDSIFKNVTRETSKEVDSKTLEILKKKKQRRTPVASVTPRTLKEKIEYAEMMSLKVLGNKLDRLELVTDIQEIERYTQKAIGNGVLAVDTETNGLDCVDGIMAGVCLYTPGEKGIYIPCNHLSYMTNMPLKENVSQETITKIFQECNNHNVKYILHNAKFDMHFIYWYTGIKIIPYWDTLIASFCLNENEPHGLKALWLKYCTSDETEEVAKFNKLFDKIDFRLIPPKVAYMYAGFDPVMTYELYEFQYEYLDKEGQFCRERGLNRVAEVFRNIEMPLIEVVFDMEVTGCTIDLKLANELRDRYKQYEQRAVDNFNAQIKELEQNGVFNKLQVTHPDKYAKLCTNGKIDINLGSPQQLAILFYDVLTIKSPDPSNPRGTGEDILNKMNDPLVDTILEYRGLSKLISTYIDAIPSRISKRTGRLHANFNQYGAKTGRFSSDEPNLQNIPSKKKKLSDGTVIDAGHDIRQMFIAGEGKVIVSGDFSQQEPRCLAHLSQDTHLCEAYLEGKDLYATIASKLYNQPYEECKEFRPDGTVNPEGKQRRNSVKPILLGIMYGRGVNSIADQMGMTKEEAQQVINDFYNTFPTVKDFVEDTQQMARDLGFVETAWGRKRRLPDMQLNPIELEIINPELTEEFDPLNFNQQVISEVSDEVYYRYYKLYNKCWGRREKEQLKERAKQEGYKLIDNGGFIASAERKCVNSVVQGSAADMTKLTMIKVYTDPILNKLGYKLIIPVHDEVLGVCPIENAKEAAERLEYIMVHIVDGFFSIPMKCDIEATERWYGEGVSLD